MLADVPTRRIDVFNDNGTYILQPTKHPKLNVTEFLNTFPKQKPIDVPVPEDATGLRPDRIHVKMQWALISTGAGRRLFGMGAAKRSKSVVQTGVFVLEYARQVAEFWL